MGQGDIADILKENYPKWLSYKDIMRKIDLSRNSVMRSLKRLSTRDDVEVTTEIFQGSERRQVTKYRIKNGK
jgi:hypothetical protein